MKYRALHVTTTFCLITVISAFDDLSINGDATQSTTYNPPPNDLDKNVAKNAIDKSISTCMKTGDIGGQATRKTVWWKVDLKDVYNIYSIHILFKNYDGYESRQRGRFAGFSLYVSITDVKSDDGILSSTLCYNNSYQLPSLNFTTLCSEYARYVIFYNERLTNVAYPEGYEIINVYTELCEVIVQGCYNTTVYGINCDIPCPSRCKDRKCQILNGTCFACDAGWMGMSCLTKCSEGRYGENCSHQCVGHCKDNSACNHVTGQCDRGCDAGWTGPQCENECVNGTYGYNCVNNCSGHCLDNSPCNKQTGHCDGGCNPGYTNKYCSIECQYGFFGRNCRNLCSIHCRNTERCDHVTGECPSGCQDGYIEKLCTSKCKNGYYGRNCSMVCSPNCKTCRHTDGLCTCNKGWNGFNCTKECGDGTYGFGCLNNCSRHCLNDSSCDKHNGQCKSGCNPGYTNVHCNEQVLQSSSDKKDNSTSTVFLLISLTINIVFITCCFLLIWGLYTRRVSILGFNPSCWRSDHYADTDIKAEENTNYQELGSPTEDIAITYQNTALR